jgi:hypothetical protein
MTIQAAIEKINSYNNFLARQEESKIVVEFQFKGKKRVAGFVSENNTQLSVGFCGAFTSRFESILEKISALKIDWSLKVENKITDKKSNPNKIKSYHYSSLAERDRLESDASNWMFTHDL